MSPIPSGSRQNPQHYKAKVLPKLEVVVLVGKKAQRYVPAIARIAPQLRVVETSHCSPLALNYSPARHPELIEKLREVAGGPRA